MCVGGTVQRVGVPDRGLDNPGSDCGEHVIGTLTVLLRIRGVRRDRRPRQEEGALGVQSSDLDRGGAPDDAPNETRSPRGRRLSREALNETLPIGS